MAAPRHPVKSVEPAVWLNMRAASLFMIPGYQHMQSTSAVDTRSPTKPADPLAIVFMLEQYLQHALRICPSAGQTINVMDLYCGAGGLSYIDQEDDNVEIITKWAVDFNKSMTSTFMANCPSVQVSCYCSSNSLIVRYLS